MSKTLRDGFTTGTAAAAAAKAAVLALFGRALPDRVTVAPPPFVFADGLLRPESAGSLSIAVSGGGTEHDGRAWAEVIKDGGDDPDATHGALVRVWASFAPPKSGTGLFSPVPGGISLHGGVGVGIATLPGLPVAVGEPAINPEPRKQIAFAVAEALECVRAGRAETGHAGAGIRIPDATSGAPSPALHLLLEIPEGEERAKRTLNPRLGIVGGISVLGTRGTVRPYSHDAWQATISAELAVARALGINELVLATGRRSERLGLSLFAHLPPQAGIQVADYAAHAMREAGKNNFKMLHWVCFPGKLLKLAQGLEFTHAKSGHADIGLLAGLAKAAGGDAPTVSMMAAMPTASGALALLSRAPALHDRVLGQVGNMAYARLDKWLKAASRDSAAPGLTLHVFAPDSTDMRALMCWGP